MSILSYLKETKGEMNHVSWPTRGQTILFTVVIIGISFFTAAFLGFFDFIFTSLLNKLITHFNL